MEALGRSGSASQSYLYNTMLSALIQAAREYEVYFLHFNIYESFRQLYFGNSIWTHSCVPQ